MDSKQGTSGVTNGRAYEDFDPHLEWAKEESLFDTLLVYLPGFLKEKLKIQITSAGKLRISGERAVGQNKWRRFLKEFPLASDCDTNKISAKFEGGILYVKVPKSSSTLNNSSSSTTTTTNTNKNNPPMVKPSTSPPKPTTTTTTTTNQKPTPNPKPDQVKAPQPVIATKPAEKQQSNNSIASAKLKEDQQRQPINEDNTNKAKDQLVANTNDDLDGDSKKKKFVEKGKTLSRLETYKRLASDRVKSPRALVNLMLAVLFVGVLALYVKNMFKSIGGGHINSNGTHEHHEL